MNLDQLDNLVHECAKCIEKEAGRALSNIEKEALNDSLSSFLSDIDIDVNETEKCRECQSNLEGPESVKREYVSKDGGESVFSLGHYSKGTFEPDNFNGFNGEERYDLGDNSDTCSHCDALV